jgi:hypothetical protein
MKKSLLCILPAVGFALAGCQTTSTGVSVTDQQVSQAISTVQQKAVTACGYLPAVETVASILATFVSSTAAPIQIATTVANGICNQVAPKGQSRLKRATLPTYKGVPIQGEFVR